MAKAEKKNTSSEINETDGVPCKGTMAHGSRIYGREDTNTY